jgi:hypothetical protein
MDPTESGGIGTDINTPIRRVEVTCRSLQCQQRISVPESKSGRIKCPECSKIAWYTTVPQPALLRTLRTLIHNQEGLAASALALLILAGVWISMVWVNRESSPYSLHFATAGGTMSWAFLWWFVRRPGLDNLLVSALKETRLFFAVLSIACGTFLLLYIWRFGTSDPLLTSQTLFQLERLRDRAGGEIASFLKSSPWRYALLVAGVVAFLLPLGALRRASLGITKKVSKGSRVVLYALTVLAAFTFGGGLHDGALSRVEPVLRDRLSTIEGGYAHFVEQQQSAIVDALTQELFATQDPADEEEIGSGSTRAPTKPGGTPNSPRPPSEGPKSPRSSGGGNDHKAQTLVEKWTESLRKDIASARSQVTARTEVAETGTSAAQEARRTPPRELTVDRARELATRGKPSIEPTKLAPWDAEARALVRSTVSSALAGRLPEAADLMGSVAETHPFRDHLRQLTKQLADGAVQGALKDLLSEVIAESLRNANVDVRGWIRKALFTPTGRAPLARLREATHTFRRSVAATFKDLRHQPTGARPHLDNARLSMTSEFGAAWNNAADRLPGDAPATARNKLSAVNQRVQGMSMHDGLLFATERTTELRSSVSVRGDSRVLQALSSIEQQLIGTTEIRTVVATENGREEAERRQAALERERMQAEWKARQIKIEAERAEAKRQQQVAEALRQWQNRVRDGREDTVTEIPESCPEGTVRCYCGGAYVGCRPAFACKGRCR